MNKQLYLFMAFIPQTSVTLGVQAVLFEDSIYLTAFANDNVKVFVLSTFQLFTPFKVFDLAILAP